MRLATPNERVGIPELQIAFGWTEADAHETWLAKRQSFSADERARRRVANKRAKASRKRNRR